MKVFNILIDDKLVVVNNNELCLYNHKNLEVSSKSKSYPYKESNNPQTVLNFLNKLFGLKIKRLISIGNISDDKNIHWNLPKEIVSFVKIQTKGSILEPDSYKTDSPIFTQPEIMVGIGTNLATQSSDRDTQKLSTKVNVSKSVEKENTEKLSKKGRVEISKNKLDKFEVSHSDLEPKLKQDYLDLIKDDKIININRVLKDSKYEYIVVHKGIKYKETKILKEAFDYANKELKEELKSKGIKAKPVYTKID